MADRRLDTRQIGEPEQNGKHTDGHGQGWGRRFHHILDRIDSEPESAPTVSRLQTTRDPASPWPNAPVWETFSAH